MVLQRTLPILCWVAAATALGCHDTGPTPTEQEPLAGLRYVNVVPDTGALDIRIVDIVGDAPATFAATFRTGGSPIGQAAQISPPYQAVAAGQRHIKVFNSSADPAIAQQVHVDTTFTFEANQDYDFLVNGFSRPGQTPVRRAMIAAAPAPPVLAGNQFAIRVVNLAPSVAGAVPTLADTTVSVDAFVRVGNAPPSGSPQVSNLAYLGASPYVVLDTGQYKLALTATGTTGPAFLVAPVPPGLGGSNPIGGASVGGSVLTAVIVPRSVAGSAAPQGGRPTARATDTSTAEATRRLTRSNDTVIVQSGSIVVRVNRPDTTVTDTVITNSGKDTTITTRVVRSRPDTTIGGTGTKAATGAAARDVVLISGADQPEYNVWQVVVGTADSLSCAPTNPGDTATKCKAANAIATTRFRFKSRIVGTPASPATGAPEYRIYSAAVADYTIPWVMYLVDQR